MEHSILNPNSHLTAKERDALSYPAKIIQNKNLLQGDVLDFGCGFGSDVELLRSKGISITGYDKHYFPEYPTKKFDTIICFYVLNVLLPEEQSVVLMELSQLIKPSGKVYIAVRRDVYYEGFRTHKLHQKKTYQCNVKLSFKSIFKNEFCEIYEYQHYNQVVTSQNDCPFCSPTKETRLIAECDHAFAILDRFPVNHGHCLIIPKKHVSNYFDLSFQDQKECTLLLNSVKSAIEREYSPDGFNVGINVNKAAGQSINHVHIHLIPRYDGDVPNPFGGVRGVIPEKKEYHI